MTSSNRTTLSKSIDLNTHKIHNSEFSSRSAQENALDAKLLELSKELLPQYGGNWGVHGLLTLKRMALSRVNYFHDLCQRIIDIRGVIFEFGLQSDVILELAAKHTRTCLDLGPCVILKRI
jgi:hypothetical protein